VSQELQATVEKPLMALLGKYKGQIEQILPRQFDGKRVLKLIIGAINKNPQLLNCTPMSVVNAVLTAATMGLEIRPGSAYLIPFKKNTKVQGGWKSISECQLVVDYRGKIDLALRGGKVTDIDPDIVYARDKFRVFRDENGHKVVEHEPTYFVKNDDGTMRPITEADRGVPIGALAVAAIKDGKPKVCFMPAMDIERIHQKSKAKDDGPWVTDTMEMWKKTVVHRICKTLPQTPEMALAQAVDDANEMSVSMDSIIEIDSDDASAEQPLLEQSKEAAQRVAEQKLAAMENEAASKRSAAPYIQDEGKPYTAETLPDACEVKVGTECLFEGDGKLRRLRATEEPGEAAHWVTVEEVGVKAQAAPSQMTPAAAITPATARANPTFGRAK
jgi:recombination protein RecT